MPSGNVVSQIFSFALLFDKEFLVHTSLQGCRYGKEKVKISKRKGFRWMLELGQRWLQLLYSFWSPKYICPSSVPACDFITHYLHCSKKKTCSWFLDEILCSKSIKLLSVIFDFVKIHHVEVTNQKIDVLSLLQRLKYIFFKTPLIVVG